MTSEAGHFMTQEEIIDDALSDPNYTYLRSVKSSQGE